MRAPRISDANSLPESEAIRLAQQGEPAAFEQLYRLHSARVFALCAHMLKNQGEAEDLTQDIFLQVFRKIRTFRGGSAFSTWLYRVAVNTVLMRLRRKTPAKTSLDEIIATSEETGVSRRELGGPDQRLQGYFDRESLQQAVAQLPPGFRLMFVLYDVQGYEHREIAKILGCSLGTSKSQLHKARRRLRELLRPDGHAGSQDKPHSTQDSAKGRGVPFLRLTEET